MTMWIEMKKHFEARASEWFSAFMLTAWGMYALLHPNLFDGPGSVFFSGLKAIADQQVWGLGALMVGYVRVTALFINGRWGVTPFIRIATSFLSIFVWFCVSVGLYKSNTANFEAVLYPGFCLSDMYSAFRAARDAYAAENLRKIEKQLSESSPNVSSIRRNR